MGPYLQVLGRPQILAQVPPVSDKNGLEKGRDVAVVVATLTGALASIYYITKKKSTFENVALGLSAAALATIGISTLINDVFDL